MYGDRWHSNWNGLEKQLVFRHYVATTSLVQQQWEGEDFITTLAPTTHLNFHMSTLKCTVKLSDSLPIVFYVRRVF